MTSSSILDGFRPHDWIRRVVGCSLSDKFERDRFDFGICSATQVVFLCMAIAFLHKVAFGDL